MLRRLKKHAYTKSTMYPPTKFDLGVRGYNANSIFIPDIISDGHQGFTVENNPDNVRLRDQIIAYQMSYKKNFFETNKQDVGERLLNKVRKAADQWEQRRKLYPTTTKDSTTEDIKKSGRLPFIKQDLKTMPEELDYKTPFLHANDNSDVPSKLNELLQYYTIDSDTIPEGYYDSCSALCRNRIGETDYPGCIDTCKQAFSDYAMAHRGGTKSCKRKKFRKTKALRRKIKKKDKTSMKKDKTSIKKSKTRKKDK